MPAIDIEFSGLRRWQREAWERLRDTRFSVLVIHRRAGKTVLAILWLLWRVAPQPNARGAYIAPLLNQARRVAWDYIRRYGGVIPGAAFNQSELSVTFPNGARIYVLGADNPHALRGMGLDAVVMDEVAQMGPGVWREVVRPTLVDRQGRAVFIGTPFGSANQFWELYRDAEQPGWMRLLQTVEDTGCIDAEEIAALKREMSEEEFAQEMMCDWNAAVRGAYFGKEMAAAEREGRVTRVPHDPLLPVHTSWDLGMADLTVIWYWQVAGSEVRAIRCDAFASTSLPEIIARLPKEYRYGQHYAPHDAKVRELGSGKSRQEIAAGLGVTWTICPDVGLASGIEAARGLLPRVWFDREHCGAGVEALKTYRAEWDDTRRVFSLRPLHSWESHYADAFRYFAVSSQGKRPSRILDYRELDRAVI